MTSILVQISETLAFTKIYKILNIHICHVINHEYSNNN